MAHKLDLDDEQIDTLAGILNVLKTEQAQARLDEQRSIAGIADAVERDDFDSSPSNERADRCRSGVAQMWPRDDRAALDRPR